MDVYKRDQLRFGVAAFWAVIGLLALMAGSSRGDVKWHEAEEPDTAAPRKFEHYKLLVLYFDADWCAYCEKLNRDVFPTPEFQALGDKAMFIRYDEKDAEYGRRDILEQLLIDTFPTLVVVKTEDNGGLTYVDRIVGYYPADKYVAMLRPMLSAADAGPYRIPPVVPPVMGGLGLTPDSNRCQPWDIKCKVGKSRFDSSLTLEDLWKTEPVSPVPAADAGQVLNADSLKALLKETGANLQDPATGEREQVFRFVQEQDGWQFPTTANLSSSSKKLWLGMTLGRLRSPGQLPAEQLVKLLEYNNSYGPVHFSVLDGKLSLALALDNVGVTGERVQSGLSDMNARARETYAVWQSLRE